MSASDTHGRTSFPLAMAGEGETVRIVSFRAGKGLEQRLKSMGLHIDAEVQVVQRQGAGGVIVARNETRLALGRGMASKIIVLPVESRS